TATSPAAWSSPSTCGSSSPGTTSQEKPPPTAPERRRDQPICSDAPDPELAPSCDGAADAELPADHRGRRRSGAAGEQVLPGLAHDDEPPHAQLRRDRHRGTVESRTTSWTGTTTLVRTPPSICLPSASTSSTAIRRKSCRTVVSEGSSVAAPAESSKPPTSTSPGTDSPSACSTSIAPRAMRSLAAKSASTPGWARRIARIASAPLATE